jgi:Group II intron, maturase-specific domain
MYNPCIRGWITYYSHFYKTRLRPTLKRIDAYVIRWARRKFKRMRHQTKGHETGSTGYIGRTPSSSPTGHYVMATAEHREPCESRGSCTVLGAPGGETPPGDSTLPVIEGSRDVGFPPIPFSNRSRATALVWVESGRSLKPPE